MYDFRGKTVSYLISDKLSIVAEAFLYGFVFLIPFIFSGPQVVVGTIVNACLFIAAEDWSYKKILPLTFLPGIAAFTHGVVLGTYTPFLLMMLPFIWISNLLLVVILKQFPQGFTLRKIIIAAIAKASFLWLVAYLLVSVSLVPTAILKAMGIIQLVTALFGGSISLTTAHVLRKK